MKITASILDYSYPHLDPAVWDGDRKLYAYQKDFIIRLITTMQETYGLAQPETWIEDIVIIGSLTTSKWLFTSDLDVHIRVNLDAFIASNMQGSTKEQAFEKLDLTRKEFDRAKILAPMTQHPIEFYFESVEFKPSNVALVGVYSIPQDIWLKEPVIFEADLDFEESKKDVIAQAEALAEELDGSFGKIKRDIQRVNELEDVIKAWDRDKQQLFYAKVEAKLQAIESEILKDLKIKQDLVDARHANQDAMSEIEVKFKWLARFGFFGILSNLKTLMEQTGGKVTTVELPLIDKIISQARLIGDSYYGGKLWFDPSGQVYEVGSHGSHADWILNNAQMLKDEYGFDSSKWKHEDKTHDIIDWEGLDAALISAGWTRVGDMHIGWGIQISDLRHVPEFLIDKYLSGTSGTLVFEDLSRNWVEVDVEDFIINGQKAVNKALQQKRLGSIKEAGQVFEVNGVRMFKNPSFEQVEKIFDNSTELSLRYIIDPVSNDMFVWDAYKLHHTPAMEALGIEPDQKTYENYTGNITSFDDIENLFTFHNEGRHARKFSSKEASAGKDAEDFANTWNFNLVRGKNVSSIKEAGQVFEVNGVRMFKNPSFEQVTKIFHNSKDLSVRYVIDPNSNDLFIWDAYNLHHMPAMEGLGIEWTQEVYDNFSGTISSDDDIESLFIFWQEGGGEKKVSSIKEAFLKEAFGKEVDQDICVDFDRTIAKAAKHPAIGEPIEGAKESLQKLKDLGYKVIIYSCRGDSEEGLKAMEEWLDKHDMPYDSIFSGEKPFFKYVIDDRAIHFDSWENVLKQVEKSEKTASTHITANLADKYWLDSQGRAYNLGSEGVTHPAWILENLELLKHEGINVDSKDTAQISQEMFNQGWSRITTESDYDFAIEVADMNNLPPYLDNFVAKRYTGGGIEIADLKGEYQDLSDPFPSLRKAIYQARRLRNAASKKFSKKEIKAQTKKVKQGDYSCLMALVPHELAQEIVEWGVRNVPDEDLYLDEDGKLGRELESHITIKYGLLTNDAKEVRRSFNDDKPFHAKLGKVRHFQPPELPFDVLTVEIVSDDLQKANEKICDSFECAKGLVSDEYKPHITIAYMKRDKAQEYVGHDGFEGKDVELDTVIFSPHKGNRTYFSISQDKESGFILEKINKIASMDTGYWVDPSGVVYDTHSEGLIHNEWILANLEMLEEKYGLKVPNYLKRESLEYFKAMETGEEDNFDQPSSDPVWDQMLKTGWARVGDADDGLGLEVLDIRKIPSYIDSLVGQDLHDGDILRVDDASHNSVAIQYPFKNVQQSVNKALSSPTKTAEFLPSLFNAPDNEWQFQHGGPDKEIALNPDSVSDETTWYAPCTEGKPRTKEVWRQFMSMFQNPFSKKEDMKVDSAYDPEMEEAEKNSLGEDQTALEYSKDFTDLNLKHNPHNTTWDSLTQDGEPSKPTSVTYSPQISNDDNLDQNSPGGFPRRFMGKPKGEWFSNEGEANHILIDMLKNREAAIDNMTIDIEANLSHAYWIAPDGKVFQVRGSDFGNSFTNKDTHGGWIDNNLEMLKKDYGIEPIETTYGKQLGTDDLINNGWIRIGDSFGTDWGVSVKDLSNVPSSVDDLLAQFAPEGSIITVSQNKYTLAKDHVKFEWPVNSVQQAVNRALRQPVMAKQASIEKINDVPVFVNPSKQELENFSKKLHSPHMFRALIDPHTGDLFVWDSYLDVHINMIDELGLEIKYSDDSPFCLYFPPSSIYDVIAEQQEFKRRLGKKQKTAGNQSASVPDYLIDEWKTDQLHDDISEEPYVNHDQRDYPYGMHDSPENTGYNIGWPKDNSRAVVRLDTLENPAYRLDPFGIGEYNVTWYTSLPASDGIEQMNEN